MDQDRLRQLAGEARIARLATVAGRRPHLVPFCFVLAGDHLYSAVDQKPKQTTELRRLRNLDQHPEVAVLVDHYEEDWSRLWWIRLDGRAERVTETSEQEYARRLLCEKYEQYRSEPPQGPFIRIDVERWSGWSAA